MTEFGAGKGTLSKGIKEMCAKAGVKIAGNILIDRDRERAGKQSRVEGAECVWSDSDGSVRLRIDISHLWLNGIEQLQGQEVVGIGKHVCGGATDLALRCLSPKLPLGAAGESASTSGFSTSGIVIALCCYHLCTWDTYINQPWLLQHGFDATGMLTYDAMHA